MCDVPQYFGSPNLVREESELYNPVLDFLRADFSYHSKPKHGSARVIAEITAHIGDPAGGQWTRPDVSAVVVRRHKFATFAEVEVLSFEVKTFRGGSDLTSVHEALAHSRFANFAYLVWNRPHCVCDDRQRYDAIFDSCRTYGVGLITMHNPVDLRTFHIRLLAQRSSVSKDMIDEYISTRFSECGRQSIADTLRQFCYGPL